MLLRRGFSQKDLRRLREEDERRARKEEEIRQREIRKRKHSLIYQPDLRIVFKSHEPPDFTKNH